MTSRLDDLRADLQTLQEMRSKYPSVVTTLDKLIAERERAVRKREKKAS